MAKLTDYKGAELIKAFLMGPPGTGKTIFTTSFPGPIKFFDFDRKLSSAYSYWKRKDAKVLEGIDYEDCSPKDDKGSGFQLMNDKLAEIKKDCTYKTIIIDSSSTMADEMLRWEMNYQSGIKRRTDIKSIKIPSMEDYRVFGRMFTDLIYELFSFPCNLIITGHIKVDQDELTKEILRKPNIPGASATNLPIYFPEVWVSSANQGKYFIQTQADFKYGCRSQLQGVPAKLDITQGYKALEPYL